MMLSRFKLNKHKQHLAQLPKISQTIENIQILFSPEEFRYELIRNIIEARRRIYIVALYIEQDLGGQVIMDAIYLAKKITPQLEIAIFVDWHRAQRGRIGASSDKTNADWYYYASQKYINLDIPIYGVPVNKREAFGVMHLKGFVIDDYVIYSGASLNNLYLHKKDKYCYDRYRIIRNKTLADTLLNYIRKYLLSAPAVNRLDKKERLKNPEIKNNVRVFREKLRQANYLYDGKAKFDELAITPIVGLGKRNLLNKTIHHLICSVSNNLILCTPYFNIPSVLIRDIVSILKQGSNVEIIVGDKTANDFYIPDNRPFKIIGILPYLYEINLQCFLKRLQRYIDNGQLIVRIWKDNENSYHLKGIWVDNEWHLITGNNLNVRAWRLDLENALLIHDPKGALLEQHQHELTLIRTHTNQVKHFSNLQSISDYPVKIRNIIRQLRRIRIDRIIGRML